MTLPRSFVILPAGCAGAQLLDFLCLRFAHVARSEWRLRFDEGLVQGENGQPLLPDALCQPQQRVYYSRRVAAEAPIPVQEQVLFEDEAIVIADKPHFLPVVPSGRYVRETLLHRLREKLACPTLSPAHRIDRDTAGLVLFTKRPEQRSAYQNLFRDRLVAKTYLALAAPLDVMRPGIEAHIPVFQGLCAAERSQLLHGQGVEMHSHLERSAQHFMQMACQTAAAGQANAKALIKIVAAQAVLTAKNAKNMAKNPVCYELRPSTGQRHQLRAQMSALGVPIWGDGIYPTVTPECAVPHELPPLQLLAQRLAFTDPLTGQMREFCSQLPLLPLGAAAAAV